MGIAPLYSTTTRVWRYYKVGVINTLFGYGIYALLLLIGLNMYVAQIIGHITGIAFNYFTYSRHVFHDLTASKFRFILSYTLNYAVGLVFLALSAIILSSPYLAGLSAMILTSIINFVVLRKYVFTPDLHVLPLPRPAIVSENIDHASF
ncbi:GtrA family protein [Sphingobium sp. PNB]|uniref:GtrA family protein n=1 Tax=Sphingobium sp. PNB TaxID=863934 RepID=UPI001CA459A3|nr:GtrA family protein [Sphingobium sp. PNB]MCB4861143.1 GtrA family protein [Sphingobium sp. PNB]